MSRGSTPPSEEAPYCAAGLPTGWRVPWGVASLLLLAFVAFVGTAAAHELRPGMLGLAEESPGRFIVTWQPPLTTAGLRTDLQPEFPSQCVWRPPLLDCGSIGLSGTLSVVGEKPTSARVIVSVRWSNGRRHSTLLSQGQSLRLNGATGDSWRSALATAGQYLWLGGEHIALGWDHLLFVLTLLLLVPRLKGQLLTVTAFTIAHSLTLALAVLEWVVLPPGPVEACIALSILLICVELASPQPASLARRRPWLLAFAFGLLHGLGFAGGLVEHGLPAHQLPIALFGFNLGVELGQVAAVLLALLVGRGMLRGLSSVWRGRCHYGLIRLAGGVAVYWLIERV